MSVAMAMRAEVVIELISKRVASLKQNGRAGDGIRFACPHCKQRGLAAFDGSKVDVACDGGCVEFSM